MRNPTIPSSRCERLVEATGACECQKMQAVLVTDLLREDGPTDAVRDGEWHTDRWYPNKEA
jgi:hypothetical protein